MRILYVTSWLPTERTPNAYPFVVRDLNALAQQFEVVVAHLGGRGGPIPGLHRVKVVPVPFSRRSPVSTLQAELKLRQLAKGAQVIHSCAADALIPTSLAQVRPWVHTEHWSGFILNSRTSRIYRPFLRFPDHLIAVSSRGRDAIMGRRDPSRISVVFNIAEPPSVVTPREIQPSRIRLLAVGGALASKGALVAVRTLAELRRRGVDASLTWVGEGELRSAMLQLAEELEVTQYLHCPGAVVPEAVGSYYDQCDMFFLPTRYEVGNVSVAEAQTHGRPVAIGANGGHIDYVTREWCQLLHDVEDPVRCADDVLQVWQRSQPFDAATIAKHAQQLFSPQRFCQAYADIYTKVIPERS